MALPADFNTVRVYGTYVDIQGNPVPNGSVTFTANTRLRSAATHTAVLPNSWSVRPDASGYIEVQLPTTDDPDIAPTGWSWLVTEKFGDYMRQYMMLSPGGAAIDLTNVQPASLPGPTPVVLIKTVAGRGPNAEGNVPVALYDLSNVNTTTPTSGQLLQWNGTSWTNASVSTGGGVPTTRLITAGTGLTGGGDLSADRTLTVAYGTAASTAAQGNDSRLTGNLKAANNLSDVANAATARTNLGVTSGLPGGWVDVKAAGAKGDGTTDDTAAINSAISGSAAGATIWFPPGTYKVSATIVLYPGRTYLGAGGLIQRATIAATSAVTGAILAAQGWTTNATVCDSPIRVQGLCIQGPGQTTGSAHGVVCLNFWSRFEDLQFLTIAGDALRLCDTTINGTNVITNSASENTVHKCRFDTIGGNGVFQASTSGNAFLDGQLEDCYFASIKADAIQMNNSAGWFIQRNHLYGIGGRGILCDQGFATHLQDNYIEDFGGNNATGSYYCGIRLLQQGAGWPSIVSGNFVASAQAGGTATPAANVTWQCYDLVGKAAGAEINFINNMAWRSGSAGTVSYTDAFTCEVQNPAVIINAVGNTTGATSGYSYRTIWNVLSGVSFANATVAPVGMALKGFEPFPRQLATNDAKVIRGDAALVMGVCTAPATVTKLQAGTRGTAATTPTLVRMGIYSVSGSSSTGATATLVARTASTTSNFTATWATYAVALDPTGGYPSSFTFVPGQTYALALLVVGGTTDPLYYGVYGWLGGASTLDPILTNNFATQTDLATSYTIGTNANADMPWIGAV